MYQLADADVQYRRRYLPRIAKNFTKNEMTKIEKALKPKLDIKNAKQLLQRMMKH